jgi:hypothetical protein
VQAKLGSSHFQDQNKGVIMAGGTNASIVPCMKCAGAAHRTAEGQENDHYECSECGNEFLIDWYYDGPPQRPCWPISEEEAKNIRRLARLFYGELSESEQEGQTSNSDEFF